MSFSPALSLGVLSLAEFVDIKFLVDFDPRALLDDMNEAAPEGLQFVDGDSSVPTIRASPRSSRARATFWPYRARLLNESGGRSLVVRTDRALSRVE